MKPPKSRPRSVRTLNSGWRFFRGERPPPQLARWERVQLPHTWNAADLIADDPDAPAGKFAGYGTVGGHDYYRGVGWYRRHLDLPANAAGRRFFLHFDGANQDAVVYVNATEVGRHIGGYTAFCFEITRQLRRRGRNEIAVRLSNAPNPDAPPLGGDLGHFGGIYRQVYLVTTGPVHFDPTHCGSPGIYTFTPEVSRTRGVVRIRARVTNGARARRNLVLRSEIVDADGATAAVATAATSVDAGATALIDLTAPPVRNPRLWSPESPYLYQIRHRLTDPATGERLDEQRTPLGFRWFAMDGETGFSLNGRRCFIRGIGRHQDYAGLGYAVPYQVLVDDVRRVKDLGANFMRGHYQLVPEVYGACDRAGVMCWVKTVIMDKVSGSPAFRDNARAAVREMVLQLQNHPSIIFWGHACEALGDADWFWPKPPDPARLRRHFVEVRDIMVDLERLTKELDPHRLTGNDFHTDPNPQWYVETGLTEINDFNGWNLYRGWYHESLEQAEEFLLKTRAFAPHKPYLIAEYGAGTDLRIATAHPTIYDLSPEYAERFHQTYIDLAQRYPWVAGMFIWTLADFQRTSIGDTMKHINNKGLVTGDRRLKDTFFLYRARWHDAPTVHIAAHDSAARAAVAGRDGGHRCAIRVYTNAPAVELFHNRASLGRKRPRRGIVSWQVPFRDGPNLLQATAGRRGPDDRLAIDYRLFPADLRRWRDPGRRLCINVGQSRTHFHDPVTDDRWLPDQPYRRGSFGHRDGKCWRAWPDNPAWDGIRDGIRANIRGTELQPVYQTFLIGLKNYRLDVADGDYRVELYWAEPWATPQARVFDVLINGERALANLDLAADYGVRRPVCEAFTATAAGGSGIHLQLAARRGETILCGIAVQQR